MNLELYIDILLSALLAATIFYCVLLNRRLTAMRDAQNEFEALIREFGQATRQAEASLVNLRQAGEEVGANLDTMIGSGRDLYDELKIITESGNVLADRIEYGLVGGGKPKTAQAAPGGGAARSESERELMEAMRRSR